jgi:hypothetical protein
MNFWIVLILVAAGVLINVLQRGQQRRSKQQSPGDYGEPPRPIDEPPLVLPAPRRRLLPPPLPVVRPAPPVVAEPVVKLTAPMVTPPKPPSPVVLEMLKMLKNPQSLQATILLREVLDPPLCRRIRMPGRPPAIRP